MEIGCGMGAITSLLCEKCKAVTAVELSQRRAIGTLLRCRDKENLEIIVGNLNDISFEQKFDYITLIGVLEYQGSYTDTANPYLDFLKKIKSFLKPTGKLLIAIENQYGLKYWCGAPEDHTGVPFEGMNQYTLSDKKVRTFSKADLTELVKMSGFANTYFYYPMPDYKMPSVIYSQDCLPKAGHLKDVQYYYVPNAYTLVAEERKIYEDVIRNQVFDFFANSFLVECSETGEIGDVTFAGISSRRMPEYQVATRFTRTGKVEKFLLSDSEDRQHLLQMLQSEERLQGRGVSVWSSVLEDGKLVSEYSDAPTLEDVLLSAYHNKNIDKVYEIFDLVYADIARSSEKADWKENILYTLGLNIAPDEEKYGLILKTGYLDMILRNAFWQKEKIWWFDQEWVLENVPVKFVMYRVLTQFYYFFSEASEALPISELAMRYELVTAWEDFEKLEKLFFSVVIDQVHIAEEKVFGGDKRKECVESIERLRRKNG